MFSTKRTILICLLCLIGCLSTCLSSDAPKVRIDYGEIAGGYEYTYNGRRLYSFLGIPYAKPPVLDYRFKVLKFKVNFKTFY